MTFEGQEISPGFLAGSLIIDSGNNTYNIRVLAVTTERALDVVSNEYYDIQAACSLDALFCPYTTAPSGNTHFPKFEEPSENASIPTVNDLNPFGSGGISCVFTDSDIPDVETVFEEYDGGVKGVGLKSPIIVTGWGYDTNDIPVPSGGDGESFLDNYKKRADRWKSGPLDIRWDNERKVWNASGGSSSKRGKLVESLFSNRDAEMEVWTNDGATGNRIDVNDWLLADATYLPSGVKIIVSQIDGDWYVVGASPAC